MQPSLMRVFGRFSVATVCVTAEPFFDIDFIFMERHFKSQIIIYRILLDRLHKETGTTNIRILFHRIYILVGSKQTQISVQVDTSPEVMQISGNKRIPPASIFLLAFGPVQVQDQQILFRNSFHDRFAKTPCLHGPNRIRIKIVEKFMDSVTNGTQIFRCIDRRLAFVKRIGRINTVRSVEFLFFFQEVTSDHCE